MERASQLDLNIQLSQELLNDETPADFKPASFNKKDIWALIKDRNFVNSKKPTEERLKQYNLGDIPQESTVLLVGAKGSGKSGLLVRFLDREEQKTGTIALEYTQARYCRRTRGVNSIKDVAHIWELAGGLGLSDLINCPLNESSINNFTLVIVADLSRPFEAVDTILHFLDKLNSRLKTLFAGLEQRGSRRPKAMRAHAWKKFGENHPDRDYLKPTPVPVLIVGSKWDEFSKKQEPKLQRILCSTLRYIAHIHGASIIFTSNRDETCIIRFKQLLNHHAFRTHAPKIVVHEHSKPLFIIAGQDTLASIGNPISAGKQTAMGRAAYYPIEVWIKDYNGVFLRTEEEQKQESLDIYSERFAEPAVDALRAQKDEELEKIRKNNERRAREKDISVVILGRENKGTSYSRAKAAADR